MTIQFQHAKPGYCFRPTYLGKTEGKIDLKMEKDEGYKHRIPKHWKRKGWIEEVRENINDD